MEMKTHNDLNSAKRKRTSTEIRNKLVLFAKYTIFKMNTKRHEQSNVGDIVCVCVCYELHSN